MRYLKASSLICIAVSLITGCASYHSAPQTKELAYKENPPSMVPIPPAEQGLSTVWATPYFKVSDQTLGLESPAFDQKGNLYFVSVYEGRIYLLTPEKQLSIYFEDKKVLPAGIALEPDGSIVIADVGDLKKGTVLRLSKKDATVEHLVNTGHGLVPDDVVIDAKGGIYFTDFRGSSVDTSGGLYYIKPHSRQLVPVLTGLAKPNGIALSPDGKVLWATEFGNSRLHRIDLDANGQIARFGTSIPYHFIGKAPDSMRTDVDGNVYVALYGQGRILVFNAQGLPIGQILLPGRDEGKFLKVTSMAIDHESKEMVIVARDELKKSGSWIFKSQAFAKGTRLFSHK